MAADRKVNNCTYLLIKHQKQRNLCHESRLHEPSPLAAKRGAIVRRKHLIIERGGTLRTRIDTCAGRRTLHERFIHTSILHSIKIHVRSLICIIIGIERVIYL